VTLAFTIGFWVLDFAAGSGLGWLVRIAPLSLTATLRAFERGLFPAPEAIQSAVLGAALLAATVLWLPPGTSARHKGRSSTAVVAAGVLVVVAAGQARWYVDATEDRRNSFNPADEAALRQMTLPLVVTLYLAPEDSRAREIESNVLAKLRRVVPHLEIRFGPVNRIGLFGASSDDRYGMVSYEYHGKHDESRSSSEAEILPLVHGLTGRKVIPVESSAYPGYPLVIDASDAGVWFYGVLPIVVSAGWWWVRRRKPNAQEHERSSRENAR